MSTYDAGDARLQIFPDASGFKRRLEADLRKIQAEFAVQVTADTTRAAKDLEAFRAREAADAVNLRVDVDTTRARTKLAGLRRDVSGLGRFGGGALGLNAATLGVSLLPGAALGVTQLAAALQQLSGAALVVPGAIGGAMASIGTLAIGVSGVADAYTAVTKASADSGASQANQARQAASASAALRNAVVDETQAQKDRARAYLDARQELTDLNIEVRGGQISEEQAINDALKARRDLMKGGFADALDLRDAQLRVESADQRVVEAMQRNIDLRAKVADANARGIEGSDQVVAANERVTRSQQQVADAQANLAAISTQASAAQQAAAAAMANLSPNAQEFVNTLVEMKDVRDQLRFSAQEPLFAGLSKELRDLSNRLLPSATRGLGGIGTALNRNIRQLMQSLGSETGQGLLDRILGNTADAQNRFTDAIDPLIRGIGTLVAAGTDALPRIAEGIGAVAERFAKFIEAADADGRLDRWINEGIDGFTHLGNILLNIGKSINAITSAAGGQQLLGTLSDLTGKLATFLNSAEGQQELRDFFQQARDDLDKWRPILESLPGLFKGLMDAAREWANLIVPPLADISSFLAEHPKLIAGVVTAFLAWKTIAGVASLISNLEKINGLLGTGGKGGKGGKGILGKLALFTVAGVSLATVLDEGVVADTAPPSAADSATAAATDIGSGAVSGGLTFGAPGAVIGGALGAAKSIYDRVSGDLQRGRAAADAYVPVNPPAPQHFDAGQSGALDELRAKIAAGQLPGYMLAPDGTILGPDGKPIAIPSRAKGGPGPTPSGRGRGPTGGWLTEVHSDEWILPAPARRLLGDEVLWALTRGRSFAPGGYIDEHGNPVTPGAAPGPPQVAPNPYQGGGVSNIIGSIASGAQGPIGNLLNLGANLAGGANSQGGGMVPGLWGLAQAANNPDAMAAWSQQTGDWLANWGASTLSKFGTTLFNGVLGFFGLENSILSASNPWNQAAQQTGQFFLGQDGPFAGLMGGGANVAAPQSGQQMLTLGDGSTIAIPTFGTAQGATHGAARAISGSSLLPDGFDFSQLPVGVGAEGGLQNYTIAVKRAISQAFPAIRNIGGYRQDEKHWHPDGLAIDVMIPGGSTRGGRNAEGKALGDKIYAYVMANKDKFHVDYILWRTDEGGDHFDHLHVNTTGGGYPATHDVGGRVPPGVSLVSNQTGGEEYILNRPQAQRTADALEAARKILPSPTPRGGYAEVPDAYLKQLPTAPAAPAVPPPAATVAPTPPATSPGGRVALPQVAPNSAEAGGTNHTLPWINQAIESGAAVAANAASSAIGALGGGGMPGAGAIGQFAAGGIMQFGKVAQGIANVASSLLVGTVTPGTTENPYGETLRTPQNVPNTAPVRGGNTNYFNGISDIARLTQELDLRDAADHQAALAARRIR